MAGQPVKIQEKVNHVLAASSLTVTPTSTTVAGNALLVAVIADATQHANINGVTDSQGNDAFGVPINSWVPWGGPTTNGGLIIQWYACRGSFAITDVTIEMSANSNLTGYFLEYSGLNGIGLPQLQTLAQVQNTNSSLKLQQAVGLVPPSGAAIILGLFTCTGDTFNTTPLSGSHIDDYSLGTTPNIDTMLASQASVDAGSVAINGTTQSQLARSFVDTLVLQVASSSKAVTPTNIAQSTIQCSFLILSGGLILNRQPGFADQPDSALAAEKFSLGMALAKINQNAEFGMVRMEFFQGIYKHGDTVDLPISPVDGYAYQRNEVNYIWAVYSSANTSNGWITGPTALWYMGWLVDQDTGAVFSEEWYRNDAQSAVSNDGYLQVFTIAQRQKNAMVISQTPSWYDLDPATFTTDAPQSDEMMQSLNNNAKFSVISSECIYLGEFYNGQNVGGVVSPVDGWVYGADEIKYIPSWRWTCSQTEYTAPGWDTDWSFDGMYASVAANGDVTCTVNWGGRGGEGSSVSSTDGRIAVFAMVQRKPRYFVSEYSRPWNNVGGNNASYPYTDGTMTHIGGTGGLNYLSTKIPVRQGASYTLRYISGFVHNNAGLTGGLNDPSGLVGESDSFNGGDGSTYTGAAQLAFSGLGCFTDDDGAIVLHSGHAAFHFGSGTTSLTVPTGATHIQLGVDNGNSSNLGNDGSGWWMSLTQNAPAVANKFAEVDDSIFYAGNLLPASIMLQMLNNANEASFSPEFFGPTDYGDGDTISAPTSPIDGYVYSRAELTYLWDWKYVITGPLSYPPSSNNERCAQFTCTVDQSNGAVRMSLWRLQPGGPYQNYPTGDSHIATDLISVIVIGFRTSQQTPVTVPTTDNAPSGSTTTAGDGTTVTITVNGT